MKLSIRIPLIIGAVAFVTSAGIGIISLQISSSALERTILEGIGDSNQANADLLSVTISGQLDMLGEIANRTRTRSMDWELIQPALLPDIPRIGALDMAVAGPDGISRYVVDDTTVNIADRDYFRRAMAGEKNVEVVFSRLSGRIVVLFAAPIFGTDEPGAPVIGVLISRKDGGRALSDMVVNLRNSKPSAYSYLTDMTGTLIAHRDTEMVTSQFNPIKEVENNPSLRPLADFVSTALRERSGISSYRYDGRNLLGHFTEVPGQQWMLFTIIERSDVDDHLARKRFTILSLGLAFLVVALLIAYFIGRSIVKPITEVAQTLKDISEGEGDLTHSIPVKSNDELGELARAFNLTLMKIRNLVVAIKTQSGVLSEIGDELAGNMNETASSMNQIAVNIQGIKSRVMGQSASVTEARATMEQVSVNIDRLNGHVALQTNAVAQSSSAIEEMMANIQSVTATLAKNSSNVKHLRESSEFGRYGLQEVAADIQEIARESAGLMEINSVMENIASQTNLLSMNAAIEAAHAGEAGKGFAVVAGEIRKLAESSKEQSNTIGTVLRKIAESIGKITKSTDNVLNKFESIDHNVKIVADQAETISNAMEEQSYGSRQILDASGKVNEITQRVKGESVEMLDGSREVIQESKNLERMTQEITGGINEMSIGADHVNTAVSNVTALSARNRENISVLVRAVSQFKV